MDWQEKRSVCRRMRRDFSWGRCDACPVPDHGQDPWRALLRILMASRKRIVVVSDIHYAGPDEQARRGHENRVIPNPLLRRAVAAYRRHIWLRDPFAHNALLDRFVAAAGEADLVVGDGDYSCDTAFVGVSDDAACASVSTCLALLRRRFGERLALVVGDHELGKMSIFGGVGGLRLASWRRMLTALDLQPFWQVRQGRHLLLGIVSSLVALPVFAPETLPEELPEWRRLREEHLANIRRAFAELDRDQRVLLFCHDPTALPFLWREPEVHAKLDQVDCTVVGHLHTGMVLWQSRVLSGMPPIRFLGNSVRRMTEALREARYWRPFKVRLCPSLAGSELLKDGGYCSLDVDADGREATTFHLHRLPR